MPFENICLLFKVLLHLIYLDRDLATYPRWHWCRMTDFGCLRIFLMQTGTVTTCSSVTSRRPPVPILWWWRASSGSDKYRTMGWGNQAMGSWCPLLTSCWCQWSEDFVIVSILLICFCTILKVENRDQARKKGSQLRQIRCAAIIQLMDKSTIYSNLMELSSKLG